MKIEVNISDYPEVAGIKRRVVVYSHHKSYFEEKYSVPYTIEHYKESGDKLSIIPDHNSILYADNSKRIWVKADGSFSETEIPDGIETGMYDYFELLQKNLSDSQIIAGQILRLDSLGQFNTYV